MSGDRQSRTKRASAGAMARAGLCSAAVAVLLTAGASAAQAQSIVVRSTGPTATSHPRGQRLPQGASITLKANDIVTILDKAGTRELRGPGTFRLDGAVVRDNGFAVRLSRSLGDPAGVRPTLRAGAVRGFPGGTQSAPLPDTIWLVDVDAGGTFCVPQGSAAYLWRADAANSRSGALGTTDSKTKVSVQWPPQKAGVVWPSRTLPLSNGSAYRFTGEETSAKPVELKIVALDPSAIPANAAGLGALLLDKGCTAQFDWLASSLKRLGS